MNGVKYYLDVTVLRNRCKGNPVLGQDASSCYPAEKPEHTVRICICPCASYSGFSLWLDFRGGSLATEHISVYSEFHVLLVPVPLKVPKEEPRNTPRNLICLGSWELRHIHGIWCPPRVLKQSSPLPRGYQWPSLASAMAVFLARVRRRSSGQSGLGCPGSEIDRLFCADRDESARLQHC